MMTHAFNPVEYQARKDAAASAQTQAAANPNTLPALRQLVQTLMQVLGM